MIFRGEDITKVNRKELSMLRRKMQMIFQDPFSSLNPRMTVFQTLSEPMVIAGELKVDDLGDGYSRTCPQACEYIPT